MKISKLFVSVYLLLTATTVEVYAYLDPGTGSILLQGLIAAVATGLATGKLWWHKVKSIFIKPSEVDEEQETR